VLYYTALQTNKNSVMAGTHALHLSDTEHYARGEIYLSLDD